jgi:hypothetical protein
LIVEGGADADGSLTEPHLLLLGDLLDGARGAHLAAEDAGVLAIADAGDQDRRPDTLHARLEERRVERVVGAHLHALGAADATLEELALLDAPRRTDHARVVIRVEAVRDAHGRDPDQAGPGRGERRTTSRVGGVDGGAPVGEEAELDHVLGAGVLAVEAHVALVLPVLDAALGAVGALAVDEAEVAVGALRVILLHAEEGEAGENAEERAERAEHAAPEPGNEPVHEQHRHEQEADEPRLVEIELLRVPHVAGEEVLRAVPHHLEHAHVRLAGRGHAVTEHVLSGRDHGETDGPDRDADGIEEAADGAAGDRREEEGVEQVVLRALVEMRLVRLHAGGAPTDTAGEEPGREVMERAEGADPAAEHATEDQRHREEAHRPEQAAVHRVRGEQRHRPHERIGEKERLHRQGQPDGLARLRRERAAERRLEEEEHEQGEEPCLRHAPHPDEDLDGLARRDPGAGTARIELLRLGLGDDAAHGRIHHARGGVQRLARGAEPELARDGAHARLRPPGHLQLRRLQAGGILLDVLSRGGDVASLHGGLGAPQLDEGVRLLRRSDRRQRALHGVAIDRADLAHLAQPGNRRGKVIQRRVGCLPRMGHRRRVAREIVRAPGLGLGREDDVAPLGA